MTTERCERCGERLAHEAMSAGGEWRRYVHRECPRCGLTESRVPPHQRLNGEEWARPQAGVDVGLLDHAAHLRRVGERDECRRILGMLAKQQKGVAQ